MTKIYLDTSVILDLYIPGREGKAAARMLLDLQEASEDSIRLYLSFLSVADIAYVLRKHYDKVGLKKIIRELLLFCNVLSMNDIFTRSIHPVRILKMRCSFAAQRRQTATSCSPPISAIIRAIPG